MGSLVTVSVLFTDVVDSTARSERLGPEAAEAERRAHFDVLRTVIDKHDGREVKNLGDGLMVVFPSIGAAVAGAVAIQQTVDRAGRAEVDPVRIRASLATGDAEEDDGDYFGPTVVEAARLCALAAPGQILAGPVVPLLVGTRGDHRFLSVGERVLKGMERPIEVFEVQWTPLGAEAATVPLPAQLARPMRVSRVGRPEAAAAIDRAWKAVRAGERHAVLLAGEAGMGKTRLASDFGRSAHGEGAIVLYGRCGEDVGAPYQPFVEALTALAEHQEEDELAHHVGRHGSALARLVPTVAHRLGLEPPPPRGGESERYAMMAAAAAYLAATSASTPVVLILDDLHWADPSSLHMVRHLLTTGTRSSLMVIGTYRDTDLSADHPLTALLADLHREDDVTRIPLRGLDDTDMVALLEGLTGHTMDEAGIQLAHALGRETSGNPFFAIEMLRHLAESEAVYQRDDGRWALRDELSKLGLPQSVREVVGRRIGRLGPDAQRVLGLAAVIGREFDLDLLAAVTEVPIDGLIDILEEAEAAGIVSEHPNEVGHYSFAHGLIEHTLYEDLSGARRQRAHEKVGLALEDLCGDHPGSRIGELAHHWNAVSLPAAPVKAITYSAQAGWAALAQNAPDDALGWFTRAIDLHDRTQDSDAAARVDLVIGLGRAQRDAGDASYRDTLLAASAEAVALSDHGRLTQAVLANTRDGDTSAVNDPERRAMVRLALDAVGDEPTAERARLLATLASCLPTDDADERRRIGLASHAVARALDDPVTLLAVLNKTLTTIGAPGTGVEQMALASEAVDLAVRLGDAVAEFSASFQQVSASVQVVDREALDRSVDRCHEIANQIGQPVLRWQSCLVSGLRALLDGDVSAAEAWGEEALVHGVAEPEALPAWGGQTLELRRIQGRIDEVVDLFAEVASDPVDIADVVGSAVAAMAADAGDLDRARSLIDEASAGGFAHSRDFLWTSTTVMYGEATAGVGDRVADAEQLIALLLPHADEVATSTVTVVGVVAATLARLSLACGRHDEAAAHAAAARDIAARLRAPYWTARARLLQVEAWQRAGRHVDEVSTALADVDATVTQLGLAHLAPWVDRLRNAAGASPAEGGDR